MTGSSVQVKTDTVRVVVRNTYAAEAEQMFSYVVSKALCLFVCLKLQCVCLVFENYFRDPRYNYLCDVSLLCVYYV